MRELEWSQILLAALSDARSFFATDELAYLALTSKIELPFRDRLAFRLHKDFAAHEEVVVSREWDRVDLAVLRGAQPKVLIELKAMYSFDMQGKGAPTNFPKLVAKDVEKLQNISARYSAEPPAIFTLLLVTHPHSAPLAGLDRVIKYASGIRSRTPGDVLSIDALVQGNFNSHSVADSGYVSGGTAFGIEVTLYYWLFGPYEVEPNNSFKTTG